MPKFDYRCTRCGNISYGLVCDNCGNRMTYNDDEAYSIYGKDDSSQGGHDVSAPSWPEGRRSRRRSLFDERRAKKSEQKWSEHKGPKGGKKEGGFRLTPAVVRLLIIAAAIILTLLSELSNSSFDHPAPIPERAYTVYDEFIEYDGALNPIIPAPHPNIEKYISRFLAETDDPLDERSLDIEGYNDEYSSLFFVDSLSDYYFSGKISLLMKDGSTHVLNVPVLPPNSSIAFDANEILYDPDDIERYYAKGSNMELSLESPFTSDEELYLIEDEDYYTDSYYLLTSDAGSDEHMSLVAEYLYATTVFNLYSPFMDVLVYDRGWAEDYVNMNPDSINPTLTLPHNEALYLLSFDFGAEYLSIMKGRGDGEFILVQERFMG